ncbi:capsular polysaccharide export protein, LipB/KpsS family [Burkholderia lata]|uniref:Capsule polysaccharide export protein n=1 Tax=Burkholderia lata (strain ATCC 17760 / DSM 23089 / LMG 22485 / NCIMB 9086 / R18194 / 383) TaxID=482957 RepID=A0A6P2JS44_BURL3|nr:capsular biosynthesis protein [Burkholderia lata]VWB45762.1 capsule polysaccharide export protein [Burkholderia lata]
MSVHADPSLQRWPNGILPGASTPALSQFATPGSMPDAPAWIDCIARALATSPPDDAPTESTKRMTRFRDLRALDPAYAPARVPPALLEARTRERILVIGGDAGSGGGRSVRAGGALLERVLVEARQAHPNAELWFSRGGETTRTGLPARLRRALGNSSARVIGWDYSLCLSLPYVDSVYTVSAPEGIHALLCGVPVHVFGTPCYAGWGLTEDHVPQPPRHGSPTLAALFEALFVQLSEHLDPVTQTRSSLDTLLDALEIHRATMARFADIERVAGVRFQIWKRPFATPYLAAGGSRLRWVEEAGHVRAGEHAALWGARDAAHLPPGAPVLRIEDGFLHSCGLGSDMNPPYSQVIDRRGLYFDPSRPSDLTVILNEAVFEETELRRACALRVKIAHLGITKYNLGRRRPRWRAPAGRRVILVPGQVADDASIRFGTRGIQTAETLLHEVRARHPDAFIVYRPHPDVLSGNRHGLVDAAHLADRVDLDADLISLIEVADEVHTLSSLSGFDALLRGKSVHTYGLPFYAGWGLTHDALEQPWRQRSLSLDMLVAGVLLRYPVYWDWALGLFTTPEAIVARLTPRASRPLEKIQGRRSRFPLKLARWCRNAAKHALWHYREVRAARDDLC